MIRLSPRQQKIKTGLDLLYEDYVSSFRENSGNFFLQRKDPLLFPHRYSTFHDREAAAFVASTFAYGTVKGLCAFVDRLLGALGPAPGEFLRQGPRAITGPLTRNLYYRLQGEEEIRSLLRMLATVYSRHGSLYAIFMESYYIHNTMRPILTAFVNRLREIGGNEFAFLTPSPEGGSACKRLNLFLRWMVRRDGLDLGLWRDVSPSRLIMPVDTHIARVARRFRWIRSEAATWGNAEMITAAMRRYDPLDPTRYDFSLCHESMRGVSGPGWIKMSPGAARSAP